MQSPDRQKEIEFTQDRELWHGGMAVGRDLFYRTRAVINGEPTEWKEFLIPELFIDTPVWMVWEMMKEKDFKPSPAEEYDRFEKLLQKVRDSIGT